jgi:hypothetical protein
MSLAVVEEIRQVLIDRLDFLESDGAEETTASEVAQPLRIGGYRPQDWQVVVSQGNTDINDALSMPGNPPATCYETTFNIRCRNMPSEEDSTARDTLKNQFCADVIKVVCYGTDWYGFDGYAIDAFWQPHEIIETDAGQMLVNLPLVVRYRTNENDPYTVRG